MANPHIVRLKELIDDNDNYYMLLEYCEGKSMMELQAKQQNKVFTLQLAAEYISQVIIGIEAIHKNGYIHRNIRPQNILVKNDGNGIQVSLS
jgi:serine/threonine protein kinase